MNILVLSDSIGEPLYAPRVTFLCQQLTGKGHNVCLVVEKYKPLPFAHDYEIIEIPIYRGGKADWVIKNVGSLSFDYKNKAFYRKARKKITGKCFDVVLTSTFTNFALLAGFRIARERNIPFVADLRDIAEQAQENEYLHMGAKKGSKLQSLYRRINIHRRNKWLRMADALTTISQWHCQFLKSVNPNTKLIYNGYDSEVFKPLSVVSDYFDIVYTGKWYSDSLQDPALLFEALRELRQSGSLPSELRLVFYTSKSCQKRFLAEAERYGVRDIVLVHDYVSRNEVPTILHGSSVMLVLSNGGTHGILTTKFYEYLGCEKPILCVRSDEGELSELISYTQSGVAAISRDEVMSFLLEQYALWKSNGYTHCDVKHKELFTRQCQVEQFEELLSQLVK